MTKKEYILDFLKEINCAYNHPSMYDDLKRLLDEMEEEILKSANLSGGLRMNDLIRRQAVLDAIDAHKYSDSFCEEHNIDWSINLGMVHILVNELPSVQSKIGQWIKNAEEWQNVDPPYICSECGRASLRQENFCCSCGADMRGDADAECRLVKEQAI